MRLAVDLPSTFFPRSVVVPALVPVLLLHFLLLLQPVPSAAEASTDFPQVSMSAADAPPPSAWSLNQLAHEFRTTRARPTRFDGADVFSDDVDSQDKKKHDIMETLRGLIGRMGSPEPETEMVVAALGPPDFVSTDPEVTRGKVPQADTLAFMPGPYIPDGAGGGDADDGKAADAGQYYIGYKWRGLHDYMWFRACGGRIKESGWYYTPAGNGNSPGSSASEGEAGGVPRPV